jgi:hypothetical protein
LFTALEDQLNVARVPAAPLFHRQLSCKITDPLAGATKDNAALFASTNTIVVEEVEYAGLAIRVEAKVVPAFIEPNNRRNVAVLKLVTLAGTKTWQIASARAGTAGKVGNPVDGVPVAKLKRKSLFPPASRLLSRACR